MPLRKRADRIKDYKEILKRELPDAEATTRAKAMADRDEALDAAATKIAEADARRAAAKATREALRAGTISMAEAAGIRFNETKQCWEKTS